VEARYLGVHSLVRGLRPVICVGLVAVFLAWAAETKGQAFGVPTSDRVVRAEIQLPDGKMATVDIREGTLVTLKNRDLGFMVGLSPSVDEVDGHVELLVVDIDEVDQRSDVQFLAQQGLALGEVETIQTFLGELDVRLLDVFVGTFPRQPVTDPGRFRPKELEKQFGVTSGGTCCVTCGPWTICGSSVRLSCGSCDSGGFAL